MLVQFDQSELVMNPTFQQQAEQLDAHSPSVWSDLWAYPKDP